MMNKKKATIAISAAVICVLSAGIVLVCLLSGTKSSSYDDVNNDAPRLMGDGSPTAHTVYDLNETHTFDLNRLRKAYASCQPAVSTFRQFILTDEIFVKVCREQEERSLSSEETKGKKLAFIIDIARALLAGPNGTDIADTVKQHTTGFFYRTLSSLDPQGDTIIFSMSAIGDRAYRMHSPVGVTAHASPDDTFVNYGHDLLGGRNMEIIMCHKYMRNNPLRAAALLFPYGGASPEVMYLTALSFGVRRSTVRPAGKTHHDIYISPDLFRFCKNYGVWRHWTESSSIDDKSRYIRFGDGGNTNALFFNLDTTVDPAEMNRDKVGFIDNKELIQQEDYLIAAALIRCLSFVIRKDEGKNDQAMGKKRLTHELFKEYGVEKTQRLTQFSGLPSFVKPAASSDEPSHNYCDETDVGIDCGMSL